MKEEGISVFWKQLLLYAVICIVVFALDRLGIGQGVRMVAEKRIAPLELIGHQTWQVLRKPVGMMAFYRHGVERIADLESRLAERTVDSVALEELRRENERMKTLLGSKLSPQWKFVSAQVLGKSFNRMIIFAGTAHGIHVGMSVVANDVLIGKVDKVSNAQSEVLLLTSPESGVAVVVGEKRVGGVIKGKEGGLVVEQLLQGANIQPGDLVLSSGTDQTAALVLIGRIGEVDRKGESVYWQAQVQPLVNYDNLDTVFVVTAME